MDPRGSPKRCYEHCFEAHLATERGLSWVPKRFIRQFLQLDFSHLGARRIVSVRRYTNAPGTFCGSLAHTDPQKVLDLLRADRHRLHAARADAAHAPMKRCHLGDRSKSFIERPISESRASFSAKTEAGRRCLRLDPRLTVRRRVYYPSHPHMAKVELEGAFSEVAPALQSSLQ